MQLITQEEIDALPEDQEDAFVEFHRIVKSRLDVATKAASQRYVAPDQDGPPQELLEAREEYMTIVVAAAREYGIARADGIDPDSYYDQEFRRLYRFATAEALRLSLAAKARRSSIVAELAQGPKARLRKHLGDLEAALEASSLPEARKKALRNKLAEFAAELEKPRSNVGRILAIVALVAAALGQTEDLVIKLPETVEAIVKIIGEVKGGELQRTATEAAISGPEGQKAIEGPATEATANQGLAEEIPF